MFLRLLVDVLKQRLQNKTIGRRKNIKLWRRESSTLGWGIHELLPRLKKMVTLVLLGVHVDGLDIRRYFKRETQRFFRNAVPAADRHNHQRFAQMGEAQRLVQWDFFFHFRALPVYGLEHEKEKANNARGYTL